MRFHFADGYSLGISAAIEGARPDPELQVDKWAEEFNAWQEDQFHYRGPNCENYPDMIERVAPFL